MFLTARDRRIATVIGAIYVIITLAYTWPLVIEGGTRIAVHNGDPQLEASILWWNAHRLPFSPAWWNALPYFPSEGVAGFTEGLTGISVIASPIMWLTGNTVTAYNTALFVTWPLSAFASYLLVYFLTRRHDVAFIGGLAYGFSVYRTTEVGHLQMLSSYWLPVCLLALHGYLSQRRARWLWLFAVSWLLMSLSNGHFMLFGAVLIAGWVIYFCSTRDGWRAAVTIAWVSVLASIPLAPVLYRQLVIHRYYGFTRPMDVILAFSASPHAWFEASGDAWFWRNWLPPSRDNMFPGLTVLVLVAAAVAYLLMTKKTPSEVESRRRRTLRIALGVFTLFNIAAVVLVLAIGPWRTTVGGYPLRMTRVDYSLRLVVLCGGALVLMTRRTREALARRSPFVFYCAATAMILMLCFGPEIRTGVEPNKLTVMSPAPYGRLLALPGFNELRVPLRFWMLGILCLGVAAALGYQALEPTFARRKRQVFALVAGAMLFEGWMPTMRMDNVAPRLAIAEPPDRTEPILELPIGPDWDWDATFRATWHGRRVVNGVSGYDPPQYNAVVAGLTARDHATLAALTTFSALDVVVDRAKDPKGEIVQFVSSFPGAVAAGDDGTHRVYRLPKGPAETTLGALIPIAGLESFINDPLPALDGRIDTGWLKYPQTPDMWLRADLGGLHEVGGVSQSLGEFMLDYPRRLAIDLSPDGVAWERVWEGPTFGQTILAAVRAPREVELRFAFPPRRARFVKLLQLDSFMTMWRVQELHIHAAR